MLGGNKIPAIKNTQSKCPSLLGDKSTDWNILKPISSHLKTKPTSTPQNKSTNCPSYLKEKISTALAFCLAGFICTAHEDGNALLLAVAFAPRWSRRGGFSWAFMVHGPWGKDGVNPFSSLTPKIPHNLHNASVNITLLHHFISRRRPLFNPSDSSFPLSTHQQRSEIQVYDLCKKKTPAQPTYQQKNQRKIIRRRAKIINNNNNK